MLERKSSGEPGKCELHDIAECEWCALGVKNRSMYGRLWPYAEHPVTREHYCLEPVESPTGGKYPCCSFRREKPIKTSQGYAGHLASHRAHIQGSTNTINGVGVAPLPLLVAMSNGGGSGGGSAAASPLSNGDQALGKKRKRESTLTGSHETVATPAMSAVSTTSSSGGGKVMPQFVASLQPSLPRCDLEAGQLRFILLPQDSEAAAIDVVFKGHRGKLNKRAAKDADGFFVIACPLIHELLPPNDTRTTFEVSVRVEDPATHRRLFQSSLLFTHHHAAAQASAPARAESVVAGGSAPRPPARASANGDEDYDEAEEGEEEEKEEEREEEMMINKEEDEEGGDGERAAEERETKNEDEETKKEKRRKIEEEEKSGGEETPEEKAEEKMETAGVEGEEAGEASESQAMELEIAEENEDDEDNEEENDAEANVKKNEGEADGEDQKERSRFEVIGEADDNDKKVATQQGAELRPDVAVKIEAMGETIADEKVDHQQKPQRELPDLLTQLAEVAAAESHNNFAPAAARPAPSSGKANGHGAAIERPTMAEALHAMPMNTVSSLLPWAHMAAAAAGGHPLPPHFALPDCYALTPAAAAAAAAAIAADPHTAALMLPGLFQSYYGSGGPLPLSALLPPMPHASHLPPPPTTRPLAPIPASMMTSASQSSSVMSTSSSTSAISPALTAMIKAKAPSSPPTSTTTTTSGAPATAAPTTPTTPTTTSIATTATAQKPWLRGQLAPMAQMMTSIPPPKPPKPAKPAKPAKPPKVVKPVVKHTLPPPFVLQPAGSGPTTPPTAATAGTAASTSASSAPSPTVAVAPASRPLQTLAARPSCTATAGRETCRYYFYTVLPEKGKLIWVVFFSRRRHALDQYELLLHEVAPPLSASSGSLSSSMERLACSSSSSSSGGGLSLSSSASALAMAMATELEPDAGDSPSPSSASTSQPPLPPLSPPLPELPTSGGPGQQTIVLPAVPELAWIAEWTDSKTGQRLYQHKVCFQAPDSTFERRIFCATLHQRVERTMTLLGGLSLVSTTSQREQMWSRINQWFVGEVQQRLVHNCRYHPPSRRHFLNGKGSRQGSKQAQKDRFLFDELDKSVELESVPVNSLLPGT